MNEQKQHPTPDRSWLDVWHVNPSTNTDYLFIDGLRGIAVLLVVVGCHLIYINPLSGAISHFISGICSAGGCGVPIFFGISGFVISLPFWRRKLQGDGIVIPQGYASRRFWKIYPPLVIAIILFTPIYIILSGDWNYLRTALLWVVGIPAVMPISGALNPVMWSLVVEIQFYIILPLIFLSFQKLSYKQSLWMISGIFLLIPNLCRWFFFNGHGPSFHPLIDSHFPSGLDSFAFGILLAGLESRKWVPRSFEVLANLGFPMLLVTMIGSAFCTINACGPIPLEILRWMVMISAAFLLSYVANQNAPIARWLCVPLLRWFGLISYELYLFHQPIILWGRNLLGPCNGSVLRYMTMLSVLFLISVLLAAIVYRYISLPILRFCRTRNLH